MQHHPLLLLVELLPFGMLKAFPQDTVFWSTNFGIGVLIFLLTRLPSLILGCVSSRKEVIDENIDSVSYEKPGLVCCS